MRQRLHHHGRYRGSDLRGLLHRGRNLLDHCLGLHWLLHRGRNLLDHCLGFHWIFSQGFCSICHSICQSFCHSLCPSLCPSLCRIFYRSLWHSLWRRQGLFGDAHYHRVERLSIDLFFAKICELALCCKLVSEGLRVFLHAKYPNLLFIRNHCSS